MLQRKHKKYFHNWVASTHFHIFIKKVELKEWMSDVTIDFTVIQRDNPQGFCRLRKGCFICWIDSVTVEVYYYLQKKNDANEWDISLFTEKCFCTDTFYI